MRLLSINTFGRGTHRRARKATSGQYLHRKKRWTWYWSQGKAGLAFLKGFQLLERFLSDSLPVAAVRAKKFTGKAQLIYRRKDKMAAATLESCVQYRVEGKLCCLGLQVPGYHNEGALSPLSPALWT